MSLLLITTVKVIVRLGDLLTSLTITGRVYKSIFPAASRVFSPPPINARIEGYLVPTRPLPRVEY
jgi:hypothetical protein